MGRVPKVSAEDTTWRAKIGDKVREYMQDDTDALYLRKLIIRSADAQKKYTWAASRRGAPTIVETPEDRDFPLRISLTTKFRRMQ